jgi:hypothetical protein
MDKDVPRSKIGVDHAMAMNIRDSFGQLPTPYYTLAQVNRRIVIDIVLKIAVACLAEE